MPDGAVDFENWRRRGIRPPDSVFQNYDRFSKPLISTTTPLSVRTGTGPRLSQAVKTVAVRYNSAQRSVVTGIFHRGFRNRNPDIRAPDRNSGDSPWMAQRVPGPGAGRTCMGTSMAGSQ
jgi:hypothetical protein